MYEIFIKTDELIHYNLATIVFGVIGAMELHGKLRFKNKFELLI
jgi:hypothetical protein